jgi:S-adenosylmethionine hydrolase
MIVLMTDFGDSEYVGMMKGVITTITPSTHIEDLTHSITPQSVREGAWVLLQSYKYFPKGTTFVCVIDPGVGTKRAAVIIRTKNYVFVGPDNGLLYPATHDDGIESIVEVNMTEPISATFHGRDVFAKVGAYVVQDFFDKITQSLRNSLDIPLHFHLEGRSGEVVRIDHFGNIITNIPSLEKDAYKLTHKDLKRKIGWAPTYEDGQEHDIFLVTGSANTLEISAKNRRADSILKVQIGQRITLE